MQSICFYIHIKNKVHDDCFSTLFRNGNSPQILEEKELEDGGNVRNDCYSSKKKEWSLEAAKYFNGPRSIHLVYVNDIDSTIAYITEKFIFRKVSFDSTD